MISIKNSQTDSIAQQHYNACSPDILKKLKLVYDICNTVANKSTIYKTTSLQSDYGLTLAQIATLINPILRPKKKKKGNKLNVTDNEITSLVFSRQLSIIDPKININDWKNYVAFFSLVKINLKELLIGLPLFLSSEFINSGKYDLQHNDNRIKFILNYIFDYSRLIGDGFTIPKSNKKWDSYTLTSKLNLSICPYCNKNWINTVFYNKGSKVTNPQLDHFFFKARYPLLRLSFYNLVPSCETCNTRIKKEAVFTYDGYLHPYERGFSPYSSFRAIAKNTKSNQGVDNRFRIKLVHKNSPLNNENDRNQKNFDFFKLKEVYEQHGDIISEIFFIKQKHGMRYLSSVLKSDKFKDMTLEEIYRMIFSNYYNEDDFKKRPFAKLTKDIVEDLNLI
jgi:hypothetical protein